MTVQILQGDCRDVLRTLPDESVNCVVTSPPYFGLRDYGHEGQIGLEPTPDAFVAEMVSVFRDVRRVLRNDGTLWLNLGDSYAGSWGAQGRSGQMSDRSIISAQQIAAAAKKTSRTTTIPEGSVLKPKDLIGIPWRVALALQADGWYLRQDIIWHKPNPMPESVRDRCTKAHEYVFLLSKSDRYHYDADAIAEAQVADHTAGNLTHKGAAAYESGASEHRTKAGLVAFAQRSRKQAQRAAQLAEEHGLTEAHINAIRAVGITDAGKAQTTQSGFGKNDPEIQALADEAKRALGGYYREFLIAEKRNKRSVWTVPTMPFKEAHFATFPPELIEPCIKAGCPAGGTVLDPFAGTGTTGEAAWREGFNAVLIEREPEYQNDIAERMRLCLAGPDEKRREIIKRRGLVEDDAGPLFGGAA